MTALLRECPDYVEQAGVSYDALVVESRVLHASASRCQRQPKGDLEMWPLGKALPSASPLDAHLGREIAELVVKHIRKRGLLLVEIDAVLEKSEVNGETVVVPRAARAAKDTMARVRRVFMGGNE